MKCIKHLIKAMYLELDAAKTYYEEAIRFKEILPSLSSTYIEVASQELMHYDKFYSQCNNIINKYKSEDGGKEDINSILIIWQYENDKIIKIYDELRYKINNFSK